MHEQLQKLLGEIKTIQDNHKGKIMPEDIAADFSRKCDEAEAMQTDLDRRARAQALEAKAGSYQPVVPQAPEAEAKGNRPVAYMELGDYVALSTEVKNFVASGMSRGDSVKLELGTVTRGRGANRRSVVALTSEQKAAIEQKAPPTIGTRVIPFDRDQDLVLADEYVPPTLLDVLNVVNTDSNTVEWVRRNARTRGAAAQVETITEGLQAAKGEHTQGYEIVSTAIRTHAVWQPVTEQQLADWQQLSALINADLSDDLNQYFEEQVLYGAGTGVNFDGFFNGTNVAEARSEVGDTIIDEILRGMTDIRRAQFSPNGIVMDPLDWEEVALTKGEDLHYIRTVVNDGDGPMRIWGLPVYVTTKAEATDESRNVLIGDFARGATLYLRQGRTVTVGLIDDQLIRNMRTILMEQRAGFAIRRPAAFRKIAIAAPAS